MIQSHRVRGRIYRVNGSSLIGQRTTEPWYPDPLKYIFLYYLNLLIFLVKKKKEKNINSSTCRIFVCKV